MKVINNKNTLTINGVTYTLNKADVLKVQTVLGLIETVEETPKTVEQKKTPNKVATEKATTVVGSLEQDGLFVRTIKGAYLSSKARYAIKMSAEQFGAIKLGNGNKVYDKCKKSDKYVQVYQFDTLENANKFMTEQSERLASK